MDIGAIPLFAMLKGKMAHDSQRQRVIAENVANADVPNYTPRDLKPFTLPAGTGTADVGAVTLAQPTAATRPAAGYMDLGEPVAAAAERTRSPDSETRLDGNRVVLEEQMVKMSEARMDYDAVVGFYQQSMGLLKMAIQKPGG